MASDILDMFDMGQKFFLKHLHVYPPLLVNRIYYLRNLQKPIQHLPVQTSQTYYEV
jgi:hypothetical protein